MFLCSDTIDMNGVKLLEFAPDHFGQSLIQENQTRF